MVDDSKKECVSLIVYACVSKRTGIKLKAQRQKLSSVLCIPGNMYMYNMYPVASITSSAGYVRSWKYGVRTASGGRGKGWGSRGLW